MDRRPNATGSAGLFLILALVGSVVFLVDAISQIPASVAFAGAVAAVMGVLGLCVISYRLSRWDGASFGRSLWCSVKDGFRLMFDLF